MANNSQQQPAGNAGNNRPAPVPGRPLPPSLRVPPPIAAEAAALTAPAKGAVLLHIHTADEIATHVVENATVMKLRSQFGKGPGFEKFLMTKLRNLLVSA